MKIHGLTGGIGSGKSTVARQIAAAGVPVIDADQAARSVVAKGSPGLNEIVEVFGAHLLTAEGELDRPALGAIVFSDPEARRRLEAITHPKVRQKMAVDLQAAAQAGHPMVFLDIPLLYEARDPQDFETITVVWVDQETQLERVMNRDRCTPENAMARIRSQASLDEKADKATWVIDNNRNREFTSKQVDLLVARLTHDARNMP